MTGLADWTLIRGADGGIMGVASSSTATPLKVQGFTLLDTAFTDAVCYCDWQFVYTPPRRFRAPAVAPGTPRPAPTNPAPGATPRPVLRPRH
jgi:hypothetical protein